MTTHRAHIVRRGALHLPARLARGVVPPRIAVTRRASPQLVPFGIRSNGPRGGSGFDETTSGCRALDVGSCSQRATGRHYEQPAARPALMSWHRVPSWVI